MGINPAGDKGGQHLDHEATRNLNSVPNSRGHSPRSGSVKATGAPRERGGGGATRGGRPVTEQSGQLTQADRTGTQRQAAAVRARTSSGTRASSGRAGSGSVAGKKVKS